jgi:hypothetical protein
MRTRRRAPIEDLRRAVDCLPTTTKVAMLQGIRANDIIVGAYSDPRGICPMLAAHRAGGRTSLISFARAWDRFAFGNSRSSSVRRASGRELRVLATALEASLLEESMPRSDLAAAIAEHCELVTRRRERAGPNAARADAGDANGRARLPWPKGTIRIYRQRDLEEKRARRTPAAVGARPR